MGRKKKQKDQVALDEGRDLDLEKWLEQVATQLYADADNPRTVAELAEMAVEDDTLGSLDVDEEHIKLALAQCVKDGRLFTDDEGRLLPKLDAPEQAVADAAAKIAATFPKPAADGATTKRTRYLSCLFTPKERGALSKQLTGELAKLDQLDGSIGAAKERLKLLREEQDLVLAQARTFAREHAAGRTYRNVEIIEFEGDELTPADPAFPRRGILAKRADTGEVLDWREFKREERQGDLFSSDDSKAAAQ